MRVCNWTGLVSLFFLSSFLALASTGTSAAHAGDRREDEANKESPDRAADNAVGDNAGDSTDPAASPDALTSTGASLGGHWSGGISDNSLGAGSFDLFINHHNKTKLRGGFDMSFASSEDFVGSLSGVSNKSGVHVTLKPNRQRNCRVALTPTSVSNSEIKGDYSITKCSGLTGGTFDVTFEHP